MAGRKGGHVGPHRHRSGSRRWREEATPLPSGSGDGWLFQRNIDPVAGVIAWKKQTFRRVRDRSELCKPGRNCGPTFVT